LLMSYDSLWKSKNLFTFKIREILVICLDVRKIHKLTNTL
jgi:hypothetical protein